MVKPDLTEAERLQMQNRSAKIEIEVKLLAQRKRRAIARGTAAHSIRLLETPRYAPGALGCSVREGKPVVGDGFTLRSVVKGGGKLKDPCSIVLEPHPSQRHYIVTEGSKVGFPLFFCVFQQENADNVPFFVDFNKK